MKYRAGCPTRQAFDPLGPPAFREADAGGAAPASRSVTDELTLLQRAAEIMATGALTEEQAKTLSSQILRSRS